MLEPYDGKLSRTVLRRESGSNPADLADSTATLHTPDKAKAFTSIRAEVENPATDPVMVVSLDVNSDKLYTAWLGSDEMEAAESGTGFQTTTLRVSGDGENFYPFTTTSEEVTGQTLTARIPLELNTGEDPIGRTAELYLGEDVMLGWIAQTEQEPVKFVREEDLSVSVSVMQADGQPYDFKDDTKTIYVQDSPVINASYRLTGTGFAFGGEDQFVWSADHPDVARIAPDGTVTPTGKAGEASFTLTAKNGGIAGKEVKITTEKLRFDTGLTPFLVIPNNTLTAVDGQETAVYWSSNLCDKNGSKETAFTVTVTGGTLKEPYTAEVKGTAENPAASAAIPGSVLRYDYRSHSNEYKVTVASEFQGTVYEAEATITLTSKPAIVRFGKLSSYYITDTQGPVDVSWTIESFDRYDGGSGQFEMLITKGTQEVARITEPGTGSGGVYTGSYTLSDIGVTAQSGSPTSYRDVYTATVKAKNGADNTWSYDSFLLYVYDEDALKIWVEGEDKDSVTLSNVSRIANMDQEGILALKRDIPLKSMVSVNYGEYAWSELADQIAWKSQDSAIASVNYQQGTLYEDIEHFTYTSYRPTTDFGLSGRSDGTVEVSATHKLTGMSDSLNVTVETLKDKLYLFQCYPQGTTTLTYTNGEGIEKTVKSDESGAAAVFEESGIVGDVYCSTEKDGVAYLGTFAGSTLKTGEGDWTQLERYPCNNMNLRRAAYAYLYIKKPDGTPFKGEVNFRGGVYVNDEYKETARFALQDDANVTRKGYEDNRTVLDGDGRLTVIMDQTQWELPENVLFAGDKVEYVFEISLWGGKAEYYPILVSINANASMDAFVGSGEAIINFRENSSKKKQPFIAMQAASYSNYTVPSSILDETGYVGPNDSLPEAIVSTMVMWWGEDMEGVTPKLQLRAEEVPVADGSGEYSMENTVYPFLSFLISQYNAYLTKESLEGAVDYGSSRGAYLDYYKDGQVIRQEALPFRLSNLRGAGRVEDSQAMRTELESMGEALGVSGETKSKVTQDEWVSIAIDLVGTGKYTVSDKKNFQLQIAPTNDPTKFMGLMKANLGDMNDKDQVTGIYGDPNNKADFDYAPGFRELSALVHLKKRPYQYGIDLWNEFNDANHGNKIRSWEWGVGGYMESLIYYDFDDKDWKIQILNGGFNAGGGASWSWHKTTWVGVIPFTTTLSVGGTAQVKMDALSVSYYNERAKTYGVGNDFLTELRLYLYLRLFAGLGFDYSIIACKLGIFGQIDLDMSFRWLNRPYMDSKDTIINTADGSNNRGDYNLDGQSFKIDGMVGLEFLVKFLFVKYEKVLWSEEFKLLDKKTNDWTLIDTRWDKNKKANRKTIEDLLKNGSLQRESIGRQQMYSLNLAPAMESREYLDNGPRMWGMGGFSLLSLDPEDEQGLKNLESNTYPYADPVVSEDGALVAYLTDRESGDAEDTRVVYAVKTGDSYEKKTEIDGGGFGDSQLSLSGTEDFAVSAWTRQMISLDKEGSETLTNGDQMMMLGGTEIYASIYKEGSWSTQRLTENSSPDLAPVTAAKGSRAIVAWRAVSASGRQIGEAGSTAPGLTNFDQQDMILYRVYDGTDWGDPQVLYNGTSGAVKGITAAMLEDGTAAVAYTLDSDRDDLTTADREIAYAVIGTDGSEPRNVQATKDGYLDENPQLTAVKFGDGEQERFVLGWYTQQAASNDGALDGGGNASDDTTSDIRLLEFDGSGATAQLLPDSLNQVASGQDVSITSDFRFTKNARTINDLSILWVERAEKVSGDAPLPVEKDLLKGVKLYTYGQNNELVGFTGVVDVADMGDGTLIDHFDAYVGDSGENQVKAVILGATYGAQGAVSKTAQTVGGDTVQVQVPSQTSAMYTATATYADKIAVPAFIPDYDTVKLGAKTQIEFTVENQGIHAVSEVEIQVGDTKTQFDGLNLLPGNSIRLMADYQTPEDKIVDPDYRVTAVFNENTGAAGGARTTGSSLNPLAEGAPSNIAEGKLYLDLPDVAITEAKIVREEAGERTIQVKLNNHADAALAGSHRSVELSFYSDAAREEPIHGLEPISIAGDSDLAMVDEGGYSVQTTFDVGEYVKSEDGAVREIPEGGVTVYLLAEVLDETGEPQGEPDSRDNAKAVVCESLKLRTGKDVSITTDLAADGAGSLVTVNLQNNRLTQTETGNVIVSLLDKDGKVLAQKQSYTGQEGANGLITLGAEEKRSVSFAFDQPGAKAIVTYSDAVLDDPANTGLKELKLDGIPLTYDEETKTWSNTGEYAIGTNTVLTVVPEDVRAAVTVDGAEYTQAMNKSLGQKVDMTIVVTSADGENTETYHVSLSTKSSGGNSGGSSGGNPGGSAVGYRINVQQPGHGRLTVSPAGAREGGTVTVTATPDEGYELGGITVTDSQGKAVEVKESGGKYTFTMPAGDVTVQGEFVPAAATPAPEETPEPTPTGSPKPEETPGPEGTPKPSGTPAPSPSPQPWRNPFPDVPDTAWYIQALEYVCTQGLMAGYGNGRFGPGDPLSRGQFAQMIYSREGRPAASGSRFSDVKPGQWYADAVNWAVSEGIAAGYSDRRFGPNDPITREQLAVMLWRYAGSPAPEKHVLDYRDKEKASGYAQQALCWAGEQGVITGKPGKILDPKGIATRAEAAQMLKKYSENTEERE